MNNFYRKPEILSPAGNPEKMHAAVRYGADAVYLAGREFGMRAAADNFSVEELAEAASFLHSQGKKMYVTTNTLMRGEEYPAFREFLREMENIRPDGFIIADLGVFTEIKETLPWANLHISTQASICSPEAALAWVKLGASRLVLARELSLEDIRRIRERLPDEIELEAFVHGSMCVSYSGRCMLSNALTGRDANRGACTQPCRWNYTIYEEKRPNTPIPVEQTELGTFIMSSKDMCMINKVGQLAAAGVSSFKIEGRIKSAYYTAVVSNAYRMAVDALDAFVAAGGNPCEFSSDPALMNELESVSHREYAEGFFFEDPMKNPQMVTKPGYVRDKAYLAIADGDSLSSADGTVLYGFTQRNKLSVGDGAEMISPGKTGRALTVERLFDAEGNEIDCAPHPMMKFYMPLPFEPLAGDILRAGE